MCGIIGYTGQKQAYPLLVAGLEKLEYRGYDSAGIAIPNNNNISIYKKKGRVEILKSSSLPGSIGIGHSRWATHGPPSDKNAHPFISQNHQFAIVHNGIIENYLELKEQLRTNHNINFTSDTDSEVIAHLIEIHYDNLSNNTQPNSTNNSSIFKQAILNTIKQLLGAYAFCVINKESNEIIGARNGSPLVIGIGKENNEHFFASDISAIIEHTRKVIYLNDFQIASLTPHTVNIYNFQGEPQKIEIKEINWNLEQAQKQGYKHFMLKEIFEQPLTIEETSKVLLPESLITQFHSHPLARIIIIACGTASYAGYVAKYLIEKLTKIPTLNEIASEFRYKEPLINKSDLVIAISQSGETADTLAALRLAKQHGAQTLGIINVIESTIAREVDQVIYTRAGPEIGVASTKAFTAQLILLYKLAHTIANQPFDITPLIPLLHQTLTLNNHIKTIAQKYYHHHSIMYIGRNINYPLALEGALKLKEISYIHAEAYPAGELKHGPIALISEDTPTIAICPQDELYDKTFSNIQEIKARSGKIIAIATEGDAKLSQIADDIIYLPKTDPLFYPLLIAIPLQLLAYHIADIKECDIDKPRNLAKSVTVE